MDEINRLIYEPSLAHMAALEKGLQDGINGICKPTLGFANDYCCDSFAAMTEPCGQSVFEKFNKSIAKILQDSREEKSITMNGMFNFNGNFGKITPGMCKLSINGGIAVKTNNGYKTYDVETGRLTNCDNFVLGDSDDMFFVLPANKVKKGDIILADGKPKCVIDTEENKITALNYEDSTIVSIIPEHHVFMGSTYFYGKVVSLFGNNLGSGKKGVKKLMSYMMMSEIMKGNSGVGGNSVMSNMLPFMMFGGNMDDLFDGMFDFDFEDTDKNKKE